MKQIKQLMGYCATAKESGRIVAATLFSLLLPLSFLLLARQSTVRLLLSTSNIYTIPKPKNEVSSFLCSSIFFRTEAITLVSILVCMISAKSFIHGLPFRILPTYHWPPCFYMNSACIIVCTMLVFVVLGLQGSVDAGVSQYVLVVEKNVLRRLFFCIGLYDTMIFWWKCIVKPVVDETVSVKVEGTEYCLKLAVGLSFGVLWWWWLMEEVEALAAVPLAMHLVGVLDFATWGVYSLTVMNGIVKVLVQSYVYSLLILIHWVESRDKNSDLLLADYEELV